MRQSGRILITGNSWKELNFKRYVQLFRNAASDGQTTQAIGRAALGTAVRTPLMAARIGKFLLMGTAMWAAAQAFNWLKFPDEEDDLPEEERNRAHITLGRDKNGKVLTFTRIGALGDFLQWFGLDAAPKLVTKWMRGERTMREIATEMAKSPVNVVVQSMTPYAKIPAELITGRSLFPDLFKPSTIRDPWLYLSRSVGLENEYTAIAGLPSKGYTESLKNFLIYSTDPGQAAFSDMMEEKRMWLKRQGKEHDGFWLTPKANALYNVKLSMKYGDKEAFKKYLNEYWEAGGTPVDIIKTMEKMHPLNGLSEADQRQFILSLNKDQQRKLALATEFHKKTLINPNEVLTAPVVESFLKGFEKRAQRLSPSILPPGFQNLQEARP
jgi:hypothetical protein